MPITDLRSIRKKTRRPSDLEQRLLSFISTKGHVTTNTLVDHIMRTECCSRSEALSIVRGMETKGLLSSNKTSTGLSWRTKR